MKALVLVPALFLIYGISSLTTCAQDQKLTGDQIVAKHLEAIGGKEAWAKFKSRIALGTVRREAEPETQFAVMSEVPNRLSVFYAFSDYDRRMIFDGNSAVVRPNLPRQLSAIGQQYLAILASGFMFNDMSLHNLLATSEPGQLKLEAKGIKKVAGRPAYVVQIKPPKGLTVKAYFDVETFMWVRTDYGSASASKEMGTYTKDVVNQSATETTVDFYIETSDFRDVDGVKLPFKFVQLVTSPILRQKAIGTITGTISEYRHNELIDPKMFQ